ncbi:TetR/AcrR family transcriptional regulator [Arthrobacter rhombi]|uniref:TetR/AcrR family transcriptional regulator n=1 Tax=Arthrobacter rhombi TaxID=71253 RepID=UPI0031DBBC8A
MSREQTILDAAAAAFAERGFHGVSMDELGRRAGLSGPALYRSFSGKDEILATLLNEAMDELMRATTQVHDDPGQDLDRALRHHVHFCATRLPLVGLYQREVRSIAEPWKRPFVRRQRQYIERWESLVRRLYTHLTADEAAQAVQSALGTIFSMTSWPRRTLNGHGVEENLLFFLHAGLNGWCRSPTPLPASPPPKTGSMS